MRSFLLLMATLTISSLVFPQATVVSGYASNNVVAPGSYALPFAPRIVTPEATFSTPPLQVGASNATEGNIAGASSAISIQGFTAEGGDLEAPGVVISPGMETQAELRASETAEPESTNRAFNSGASLPQDAFGVAQLANGRPPRRNAVRKFSNSDIDRMHNSAQ